MPGMLGKILRVDLSYGQIGEEKLQQEYIEKYIGSDALAARLLYDEMPAGIAPLDSENRLIFMTGPLTGTAVQSSCQHSVTAKSPATGFTIGHAHAMGRFGPMLKFCGYDGLIVQGKASKPVFLWIHDGQAEIKDASKLWGKDTFETENFLINPKGRVPRAEPVGECVFAHRASSEARAR